MLHPKLQGLIHFADDLDFCVSIAEMDHNDRPLLFVNKKFEEVSGYDRKDIIGKNCKFLQGPLTSPDTVDDLRASLNARRSCAHDILNYTKDGEVFINRLLLISMPIDGKDYFIGIQSNVSIENSHKLKEELAKLSSKQIDERIKKHLHIILEADPQVRAEITEKIERKLCVR